MIIIKPNRCTSRYARATLTLKDGDLLNLSGIQPLISDQGYVNYSHLIFTTRIFCGKHGYGKVLSHKQVVAYRKRLGLENQVITDNTCSQNVARQKVLQAIYDGAKHYSNTNNIETTDKEKLKEILDFRMKYMTLSSCGSSCNKVISSNEKINDIQFPFETRVKNILVPEALLPKNQVMLCCVGNCVYTNPVVSCPIIPREKFNMFCLEHEFDLDAIKFDKRKKFPFINKMVDWYELYQLYLDHIGTDNWYVETFDDFKNFEEYYTVIHFEEK